MFKCSIEFLKNKKTKYSIKTQKILINNNYIQDTYYVFKDMNVYSKKEKKFFIIPKGTTIKISNFNYDDSLSKIKYKKKKYLVSKEELDYCTFDCDAHNYKDFFKIIEETNTFAVKINKEKNLLFKKETIIFNWQLNINNKHYYFTLKNLMKHIFSHIYESYKYADNEIFSTFTTLYINNLEELFENLEKCKEKKQIKEFILVAEPLFIDLKNNILNLQQTKIYYETTLDLLGEQVFQDHLNNYKEIVKSKRELYEVLN